MTKILAYNVRIDEQPFIDQWSKEHGVQVDSIPEELHDDTVDKPRVTMVLILSNGPLLPRTRRFIRN